MRNLQNWIFILQSLSQGVKITRLFVKETKALVRKFGQVKTMASLMALQVFFTQVAWGHVPQKTFWDDRRAAQKAGLSPHSSVLLSPLSKMTCVNEIPPALGRMKIVIPSRPSKGLDSDDEVTLTQIQDVHLNTEAQKNIGLLLHHLMQNGSIDIIGLEGAAGEFDFGPHRAFPDHVYRRKITDALLSQKRMDGGCYAALTYPKNLPIFYGIDDPALYGKNLQALKDASPLRASLKKALREVEASLAIARRSLPENLAQADRLLRRYRSAEMGLGTFLQELKALGYPSRSRYPELEKFSHAFHIENRIDYPALEREKKFLQQEIVARCPLPSVQSLVLKAQAVMTGDLPNGNYFAELKQICARHRVPLARYPALSEYIEYVAISSALSSEKLFEEIQTLESEVEEAFLKNPFAGEVYRLSEYADLLGKLADLSLTPEEWALFLEKRSSFLVPRSSLKISNSRGTRNEEPGTTRSLHQIKERIDEIEPKLEPFLRFYELASERDGAMMAKLLRVMKERNFKSGVFVCGGFHSRGIGEKLKGSGAAFSIVTPKITKISEQAKEEYLSFFTQEKTPIERLFKGEPLFLSAGTAITPLSGIRLGPLPAADRLILDLQRQGPMDDARLNSLLSQADWIDQMKEPEFQNRPTGVFSVLRKFGVGTASIIKETIKFQVLGSVSLWVLRKLMKEAGAPPIAVYLIVGAASVVYVLYWSGLVFTRGHDNKDGYDVAYRAAGGLLLGALAVLPVIDPSWVPAFLQRFTDFETAYRWILQLHGGNNILAFLGAPGVRMWATKQWPPTYSDEWEGLIKRFERDLEKRDSRYPVVLRSRFVKGNSLKKMAETPMFGQITAPGVHGILKNAVEFLRCLALGLPLPIPKGSMGTYVENCAFVRMNAAGYFPYLIEDQRTILRLRYIDELTIPRAAQQLNLSNGAVTARSVRAVAALRAAVQTRPPVFEAGQRSFQDRDYKRALVLRNQDRLRRGVLTYEERVLLTIRYLEPYDPLRSFDEIAELVNITVDQDEPTPRRATGWDLQTMEVNALRKLLASEEATPFITSDPVDHSAASKGSIELMTPSTRKALGARADTFYGATVLGPCRETWIYQFVPMMAFTVIKLALAGCGITDVWVLGVIAFSLVGVWSGLLFALDHDNESAYDFWYRFIGGLVLGSVALVPLFLLPSLTFDSVEILSDPFGQLIGPLLIQASLIWSGFSMAEGLHSINNALAFDSDDAEDDSNWMRMMLVKKKSESKYPDLPWVDFKEAKRRIREIAGRPNRREKIGGFNGRRVEFTDLIDFLPRSLLHDLPFPFPGPRSGRIGRLSAIDKDPQMMANLQSLAAKTGRDPRNAFREYRNEFGYPLPFKDAKAFCKWLFNAPIARPIRELNLFDMPRGLFTRANSSLFQAAFWLNPNWAVQNQDWLIPLGARLEWGGIVSAYIIGGTAGVIVGEIIYALHWLFPAWRGSVIEAYRFGDKSWLLQASILPAYSLLVLPSLWAGPGSIALFMIIALIIGGTHFAYDESRSLFPGTGSLGLGQFGHRPVKDSSSNSRKSSKNKDKLLAEKVRKATLRRRLLSGAV